MSTTTTGPSTSRAYPAYSRPLWQRWLFTRETAVIALLVAVWFYSVENVQFFDGPLTITYLLLDMTPMGRNETGPHYNLMDWVRRHDEYGDLRQP